MKEGLPTIETILQTSMEIKETRFVPECNVVGHNIATITVGQRGVSECSRDSQDCNGCRAFTNNGLLTDRHSRCVSVRKTS